MLFARFTVVLLATFLFAAGSPPGNAARRRFTVADDIGLSHFGVPNSLEDTFIFSPSGRYFVVHVERGRIDLNRPEAVLRVYETSEIRKFILQPNVTREPSPLWEISRSTYRQGPIVTHVSWLTDSSGIAFLAKARTGNDQLVLADLKSKNLIALTPKDQHVTAFDIRSPNDFIYCVLSPEVRKAIVRQGQAVSVVGSDLESLFPPGPFSSDADLNLFYDRSELWAVRNGRRYRLEDSLSGRVFSLYRKGQEALAMSPNRRFVVTALAVNAVPLEWEKLYSPPPHAIPSRAVKAGNQDLNALNGFEYVSEYALIDLSNEKVARLSRGPLGGDAGWYSSPGAAWSSDGQFVALSDAFVSPEPGSKDHPTAPCVAVVEIKTGRSACLEKVHDMADLDLVYKLRFARDGSERVIVDHFDPVSNGHRAIVYVRSADSSWANDPAANQAIVQNHEIELSIRQSLNDPPVLVASDDGSKVTRVVWDPNPQLKQIALGKVSVVRWKDGAGREQVGGLYKPPDYVQGRRYPLVIQTHGFSENEFSASGGFPTATAAQEIAAVGILVLQIRGAEGCPSLTPKEAECNVENYEAAVRKLVSDGIVDPGHIGIIGFSWTCYHVLAALTTSSLHYEAASITDGINAGYFQYVLDAGSGLTHEFDSLIGEAPFGNGLQSWLKQSPGFNLDKIRTPLQVVGIGRVSALSQWEPYSALRALNRPVELVIMREGQHLLTNPAEREVSQGGTVDWFRFWLTGEEDTDPAKSEQYARWRRLRKLESDSR
jgi:hypothetical protein